MSMPPKRTRLTTVAFNQAFKTGKRYHTPTFQVIMVPGSDFHAAVVVGKKVHKTAVARNRLRRQLYAVVYAWHQATGVTGTYIVITKPAARTTPVAAVREALRIELGKFAS